MNYFHRRKRQLFSHPYICFLSPSSCINEVAVSSTAHKNTSVIIGTWLPEWNAGVPKQDDTRACEDPSSAWRDKSVRVYQAYNNVSYIACSCPSLRQRGICPGDGWHIYKERSIRRKCSPCLVYDGGDNRSVSFAGPLSFLWLYLTLYCFYPTA